MSFLVDANVLSEPTRPDPSPQVVDWLRAHESQLVVDPIIIGEVRFGILLLPRGRRRKRLEQWFRAAALRAIARRMGQATRGERPDWRARPHRVLFLRHDRIGDMILSTGILRVIATSHPTIRLDVLASPTAASGAASNVPPSPHHLESR